MRKAWKFRWACLALLSVLVASACGSSGSGGSNNNGNNNGTGGNPGGTTGGTTTKNQIVFTAVGDSLAFDLIDLEFLPGQNGEAIAIGKNGAVYYLNSALQVVGSPLQVDTIQDGSERGLLNVAADPNYASNGLVYFYYTLNTATPNTNRVERRHVDVDVAGNSFGLSDAQTIIEFPKDGGSTTTNHNGGSMVFMDQDHLAIGVGDGALDPNNAQDPASLLGKIHRIIPNRTTGAGGFTADNASAIATQPSTYSFGVRNPFTLVVDDTGDLFMGDVGSGGSGAGGIGAFEEINCVYHQDENYGWPICEGHCEPHNPNFVDALAGYLHGDTTFDDQDPEDNPTGADAIMVSAFYQGSQYGGVFTDKIIYNEFFAGWVRLLTLDTFDRVIQDQHISHLEGLTGLHENPADGMLYGVTLGGSDQIQRVDLAP